MAWTSPRALLAWAAGRSSWMACFCPSHATRTTRAIVMASVAPLITRALQHGRTVVTERMRSGEVPRHQHGDHQEEPGAAGGEERGGDAEVLSHRSYQQRAEGRHAGEDQRVQAHHATA